jgi:DNA-binding MarR family transcriptional regulator
MQRLPTATNGRAPADRCARGVLIGVPAVMRFMRSQMRRHRQAELTVPQFRALVFASQNHDASLSAMAEHLGLSLPAASRMVDLLVKRGLMKRQARSGDRRSVSLSLTGRGSTVFRAALQATQVALAQRLRTLAADELSRVNGAMQILGRIFAPERCPTDGEKRC